jgi:iron(III) transport system permease protein
MRKAPGLVVVLGVFAALVTTVPIGYLAVRLIQGWQAALAEILRFRTLELLGNTGLLVLAVTASALVIGFSQAWLTTKTNVVFAAGFAVSAALPLAIPSYVMALSYISIFNGLSGFFAAWLVLTLATSPLVFLAVTAALARLDSSSEEVARTLGLGKLQVLFKVTWPQVRTAATASGLLVALYVLGEFGAIALLRYDTFTRAIYNAYRGSFDRTSAAALAVVLLLITLLVIWFERKYRGGYVASKKQLGKKLRVELGIWRLPAALWLGLIAIFSTALPISSLVIWSVQGSSNLDLAVLLNALWGSVQLAGLAGIGIGIFGTAIALWSIRYRSRLGQIVEWSSWAIHAVPAIVVGLALVFFGANVTPWIYQTSWLLLIAYLILFLPNALAGLATPIAQVPVLLEEVSQSLGVPANKSMVRVVLPIALPGIVAAVSLVGLTVLKELPATLLLRPSSLNTLATRLWGATEDLAYSQAAPYALLLVIIAGLPALALNLQARRALSEVRS